jgi:hypothetical protein
MISPQQWSSGAARAHAVMVSVLIPAEVLIAARRLAETRPHLPPWPASSIRRTGGSYVATS